MNYREYIDSLGLKNISASTLIRPHRNVLNGVKNELPPKRYWKRIKATLEVVDALQDELGVPLRMINSAYRSPKYQRPMQRRRGQFLPHKKYGSRCDFRLFT